MTSPDATLAPVREAPERGAPGQRAVLCAARRHAWLLPPLAAGTLLRLWNVRAQVIGGDEMHALRIALGSPVGEILGHYDQEADHSIPLTVLYRLLMDAGVRLTEMTLRAPILVAGFLLLLAGAWLLERALGRRIAALWAWAAALSPLLVLYSRLARSYMPMALLCLLAAAAFHAWMERRRWRSAAAYVACSALAVYFHLLAAPFVLAPFVFAALRRGTRRSGPGWGSLAALAGCTAGALALLLAPGAADLARFATSKARQGSFERATLDAVLQNQAGTWSAGLVALFWLAALAGFVLLLRRIPRLALYAASLVGLHVASLFVLAPAHYENPVTFNRYVLVALPLVLGFLATALGTPWWRGQSRGGALLQGALAYGLLAALFATGPLASAPFRESSLTHHNRFLAFERRESPVAPAEAPAFYAELGHEPGRHALVECPFSESWGSTQAAYYYQGLHRQAVLAANPWEQDPRLDLRNLLPMRPERFLASRARYLVVHADLGAEELALRGKSRAEQRFELEWRLFLGAARSLAWRLRSEWGEPCYADERIQVWDLDRARER